MGFIILFTFIAIPLLEIAVFIQIGGIIGLWWTIGIVIITGLFGTYMLRTQGLSAIYKAQSAMASGQMPIREVFDGICLLFAGALLLTPGFITDFAGAILFVPLLRRILGTWIVQKILHTKKFTDKDFSQTQSPNQMSSGPQPKKTDNTSIIDLDFVEVNPNTDKSKPKGCP